MYFDYVKSNIIKPFHNIETCVLIIIRFLIYIRYVCRDEASIYRTIEHSTDLKCVCQDFEG